MGDYAHFKIGRLRVGYIEDGVPTEALAVFTDSMFVYRRTTAGEHFAGQLWDYDDADEVLWATELTAPASALRDRLDVIGVTREDVMDQLHGCIELERSFVEKRLHDESADAGAKARDAVRLDVYRHLDTESWMSLIREGAHTLGSPPREARPARVALDAVHYWDWRHLLRLLCEVFPDETVTLDLTELDDGERPGDERSRRQIASASLAFLRQSAAEHAPVVVLTEGRTDTEFLRAGLQLLRPHLADLFSFYDYTERPAGGAPAVVNTVKAFAAAGISNRVIALLDNDSAAREAARSLAKVTLPRNIRVLHLPELELARSYPTLGPPTHEHPSGAIAMADVNGLAGSIELYLGRDVLTREDAPAIYEPVKWSSYLSGVNSYQGEVMRKSDIHDRFRAKVSAATEAGVSGRGGEWQEMSELVDFIISAAVDMASTTECWHRADAEVSLRPGWDECPQM